MSPKKTVEIDGADFSTADEFYEELRRVLLPGVDWERNVLIWNKILMGGDFAVGEDVVIRWKNSRLSRHRLGYPETIRHFEEALAACDPSDREVLDDLLQRARAHLGPTIFDMIVQSLELRRPGSGGHGGLEVILE